MTKTTEVSQDRRVQHRSVRFHAPNPWRHKGNPTRSRCSDVQYAAGTCADAKQTTNSEKGKKLIFEQPYSVVSEEVTKYILC